MEPLKGHGNEGKNEMGGKMISVLLHYLTKLLHYSEKRCVFSLKTIC